ncbi:hypothetical protein NECAME_11478 [Necator americanus]|uniref:Uncharacterized protein n=1 Tax=Necator americanus TaxID=51031 RepID=W2T710_NECAM|nr:hypothetical protein NECAME_11478 [Necator americanus]ETN76762.1 hypothetical protein NECAME_11478 [Necator americanus]
MPMDPTDMLWLSKPPTVSEFVTNSKITFKPAVRTPSHDSVQPELDTETPRKPDRISKKLRTFSLGDSEGLKKSLEKHPSSSPVDIPRPRRISISEMIFGSSAGGFSWGQSSLQGSPLNETKMSITEDEKFKEFMKHQNKILGDDGICSFKKGDYME